jgi:2-methylcitrate dehydratase
MTEFATRFVPNQNISPTRTAVELISAFTHAALPENLTPGIRRLYKRNILDSLGCAIAALQAPPFSALREQIAEYRAPGNCTLIAGGKTAPDQAAFFNTALIRYVDMLDSYMAPGGLCHPSDNTGTVLAAAEYVRASGEQFMLALAISFEIQCRFTAAVSLMPKGFNHATQLAMSAAAACGKLFGLSTGQLAHAIAIATADNVSLACIHVEPISQWKGFSPAMTGMRAVYAASLAKRGLTGPRGLFEGPKGPADVEHVRCDIFESGWDFAGGGSYGSKDHPLTKEQGDYNLKYLIAAALLDGQVGPTQLDTARVQSPDAQAMVARIEIFPDPTLTARYPKELAARVTVRTKDGRVLVKEHLGYQGGIDNPLTWDQVIEKFHWLSEACADEQLRDSLIDAVDRLDTRPVSHLLGLLAQVRPMPVFARAHRGIQ